MVYGIYKSLCFSVSDGPRKVVCVLLEATLGASTMSAQAERGCMYLSLETLELVACAKDTGLICHQYA